ncbi:PAN domain-containing protein [Roseibium sediminicola]|uniref:PAN domain-containing protein n=1 Tax=Roseibium sediminicola TaxID=2933272 RepID=A0ABT0H1I6_9HYPH|nr:PAN domain-containing protein [Roseibium sp. CAU 1639]MCK7615564.1 PAN domain-containing protein [Roseibium sp. CAU 1639]
MKKAPLSRRDLLLGFTGIAVGGAVATAVGLTFRSQIKKLVGLPGTPQDRTLPTYDDGWLLTEQEWAAFQDADTAVTSDILEVRDNVDIPGGDYDELKVSSVQECVTACEQDSSCKAFTYARASHSDSGKRRACWLKSGSTGTPVTGDSRYVSGRRDGW